jgi:hypothetical protein
MIVEFDNYDLSTERAKKQFGAIVGELQEYALRMMKTPEGREMLRREVCALQGRPLGPCFEGETEENWNKPPK